MFLCSFVWPRGDKHFTHRRGGINIFYTRVGGQTFLQRGRGQTFSVGGDDDVDDEEDKDASKVNMLRSK